MDTGSREMDIPKKKSKGNARNLRRQKELKDAFSGFMSTLDMVIKGSVSLKRGHQKLFKLKCRESENEEWDYFKKCNRHTTEIARREGREHRTEEIFEVRMSAKFSTLMKDSK